MTDGGTVPEKPSSTPSSVVGRGVRVNGVTGGGGGGGSGGGGGGKVSTRITLTGIHSAITTRLDHDGF